MSNETPNCQKDFSSSHPFPVKFYAVSLSVLHWFTVQARKNSCWILKIIEQHPILPTQRSGEFERKGRFNALLSLLRRTSLQITFHGANTLVLTAENGQLIHQGLQIAAMQIVVSPPANFPHIPVNLNHHQTALHMTGSYSFPMLLQGVHNWPGITPLGVFTPDVLGDINQIIQQGSSPQTPHPVVLNLTPGTGQGIQISDNDRLELPYDTGAPQLTTVAISHQEGGFETDSLPTAVVTAMSLAELESFQTAVQTSNSKESGNSEDEPASCCSLSWWGNTVQRTTGYSFGLPATKSRQATMPGSGNNTDSMELLIRFQLLLKPKTTRALF